MHVPHLKWDISSSQALTEGPGGFLSPADFEAALASQLFFADYNFLSIYSG
jgi:hypothetical protein